MVRVLSVRLVSAAAARGRLMVVRVRVVCGRQRMDEQHEHGRKHAAPFSL